MKARRMVEVYSMTQELDGKRGARKLDVRLKLDADIHALVRQMAAAALVSRAKPKRSTMAHGAVVLTVIEETISS